MSPTHRWCSRGREPLAPDRNQTGLIPSSALSCQGASEGVGLRVAAMVGH